MRGRGSGSKDARHTLHTSASLSWFWAIASHIACSALKGHAAEGEVSVRFACSAEYSNVARCDVEWGPPESARSVVWAVLGKRSRTCIGQREQDLLGEKLWGGWENPLHPAGVLGRQSCHGRHAVGTHRLARLDICLPQRDKGIKMCV